VGERNSPLKLVGRIYRYFPHTKSKTNRPTATTQSDRSIMPKTWRSPQGIGVILGGRTATTTTDRRFDAEKLAYEYRNDFNYGNNLDV